MRFVIEVPLPQGALLTSEDLVSIHGRRVSVLCEDPMFDLFGFAQSGTVVGVSVSPMNKYLRVVVDANPDSGEPTPDL